MGLTDKTDADLNVRRVLANEDISYTHVAHKSIVVPENKGGSLLLPDASRCDSSHLDETSAVLNGRSRTGWKRGDSGSVGDMSGEGDIGSVKDVKDTGNGDEEAGDEEGDEEEEEEEEVNPVPIDRGWAWFVLLGAVIAMTLAVGLQKSSGIVFIAIQQRFDSNSSVTSLISTVQNAVYSVSALLVLTIGTKLVSRRKLVLLGGTLVGIAYIITSQATDVRVLLFSHGVLQGMSLSCVIPNTMVMVGTYFHKRRGFANSVAVSGGSLGGLIFAPLITSLQDAYGYQGCFLILGGLLFNLCISGSLYRSQSFYTKTRTKTTPESQVATVKDVSEKESLIALNSTDAKKLNAAHILLDRQISQISRASDISSTYSPILLHRTLNMKEEMTFGSNGSVTIVVSKDGVKNGITSDVAQLSKSSCDLLVPRKRQRTYTETSASRQVNGLSRIKRGSDKIASKEFIAGSMLDITIHAEIPIEDINSNREDTGKKAKDKLSLMKTLTKVLDFKLFKKPVFVTLVFAAGLNCAGNALSSVYVAPHARDVGVSASEIAQLLTIYSAVDLCSRLAVGIIADRNWLRSSTLIGISSMIAGCSSHLVRFYTSFPLLIVYVVTLGLFSGVYFSLIAIVIVDYMTLAKLQNVLGFTTMFHGTFVALTFYLAGHLRDETGSYIASFHYLASMAMVGALLMFLLPMFERMQHRQEQAEKDRASSSSDQSNAI